MQVRSLLPFAVVSVLASAACSASAPGAASESGLTSSAAGFEYECEAPTSFTILEDAQTTRVAVTGAYLRFVDGFGPQLGARDTTYRAPAGKERMRFDGFTYGGDCHLQVVADTSASAGAATTTVRVQCRSGEEFQQDVYACKNPKPVTLAAPATPTVPAEPSGPAPTAKRWTCTSPGALFGATVTMQLDATRMRVDNGEFDYVGVSAESGDQDLLTFTDFGYGGDCAMSTTVDRKALDGAGEVSLRVECYGDDEIDDRYVCR